MKVDVPEKQEGGVFSGHGELSADHLSGYWKRERQVKRKG